MKHRLALLAVLACFLACVPARGAIDSEVEAVANHKLLQRAVVGVQVMRLGSGPADMREVYARNAHVPLVPASNMKLVTTAAALEKLGPDFKFRTALMMVGPDLVLVGDGDPTFGDGAYLRQVGWKPTSVYEGWAKQLQQLNVTSVRDVIVDDGVFDEAFFHPDWPANQMDEYYEAQVGGMNFNVNVLDVSVGPKGAPVGLWPMTQYVQLKSAMTPGSKRYFEVSRQPGTNTITLRGDPPARGGRVARTIHDPPMFAATVLAETLSASGIKVTGGVKRDRTFRTRPAEQLKATVVGIHETPIAPVLARTNKYSVNVYAEALCKRMGYDPAKQAAGSWESGLARTGEYLRSTGIPESDFALADGSGMSKKNAISARAIVRVLCYEFYGRNRDAYVQSLSIAGVDGTLDDRFAKTDLQRRVFGKSGFVEGVSTLSGYLQARDGDWYAFSILVNGIPRMSNSQVKLLQERIVKAVDADVAAKK